MFISWTKADKEINHRVEAKLREAIEMPSVNASNTSLFLLAELEAVLKDSMPEKAQGPDKTHAQFLHHPLPSVKIHGKSFFEWLAYSS